MAVVHRQEARRRVVAVVDTFEFADILEVVVLELNPLELERQGFVDLLAVRHPKV